MAGLSTSKEYYQGFLGDCNHGHEGEKDNYRGHCCTCQTVFNSTPVFFASARKRAIVVG